jgi:hypothetical protein
LRPVAAAYSLFLSASLSLFAHAASAQEGIFAGLQKSVESTFSSVSTTTTFASGAVTKTDSTNIYPSLNLNFDSLVYPSLRLNAGGVFEINWLSTTSNGVGASSTISRNRPFVLLRSTNPVISPGFGYFRREDRSRASGASDIKLVNEEFAAYLGWNPVGGPRSEFQFLRTHTFDGARTFQDVTRRFGSLTSNYAYEGFGAYYLGSYLDTDDQLRGIETRQVFQSGRTSYSDSFIQKRLLVNAAYHINYQDLRTTARGTGDEVAFPLIPSAGLAAISDTPVTVRLTENPALIDGNLTAGAGIDIGVPAQPTDSQARNIGLEFLNGGEVNRFLVWVDRQLPVDIANSFSWEIYSSPDNVVWRRESIVSVAPFDPFENRFEIVFPTVSARYVKVVTRPLSAVVADSSRFEDIFVTELQAFVRRRAGEGASRQTQTTNVVNADVRMRILDTPSLYYEGLYLYNGPDAFGRSTDTISNGLSVNHVFARVFSAYARAAREQGSRPQGYTVANVANATLTYNPISTFRSSLLYTGRDEQVAGVPTTRRGVFVQNTAQFYRGVDVLGGFGWNFTTRETGEILHDRLLNVTATIVPREHVSLTVSFDDTATERSGVVVGLPHSFIRRGYVAVVVDPIRTLHLAVGEEVYATTGQRTRSTLNVSANWAPFPDGALQFTFAYNEAMRPVEFGTDRTTQAAVRWNLSRRSYVDVSYQLIRSEFVSQVAEGRVFTTTVRIFF